MRVVATTSRECRDWGRFLGKQLLPGSVVTIEGGLGVGKTLFVQGMALGLAIKELPTSPTFNIVHIYEGNLTLYHIDLYRIETRAQLDSIDLCAYFSAQAICAIEWPECAGDLLPQERIRVRLSLATAGARDITIDTVGNMALQL